jgi:hypothetical protein
MVFKDYLKWQIGRTLHWLNSRQWSSFSTPWPTLLIFLNKGSTLSTALLEITTSNMLSMIVYDLIDMMPVSLMDYPEAVGSLVIIPTTKRVLDFRADEFCTPCNSIDIFRNGRKTGLDYLAALMT